MMFVVAVNRQLSHNYGIIQFKYNLAFSEFKATFLNCERLQMQTIQELNLNEKKNRNQILIQF